MINTIALGYMYSSAATDSIVDNITPSTDIAAPSATVSVVPAVETKVVAPTQEAAPVQQSTQEQNNTSSTKQ